MIIDSFIFIILYKWNFWLKERIHQNRSDILLRIRVCGKALLTSPDFPCFLVLVHLDSTLYSFLLLIFMFLISNCLIVQLLTVGKSMQFLIKASNILHDYCLSEVLFHKSLNICQMVGCFSLISLRWLLVFLIILLFFYILSDDSLDLELINSIDSCQGWYTYS